MAHPVSSRTLLLPTLTLSVACGASDPSTTRLVAPELLDVYDLEGANGVDGRLGEGPYMASDADDHPTLRGGSISVPKAGVPELHQPDFGLDRGFRPNADANPNDGSNDHMDTAEVDDIETDPNDGNNGDAPGVDAEGDMDVDEDTRDGIGIPDDADEDDVEVEDEDGHGDDTDEEDDAVDDTDDRFESPGEAPLFPTASVCTRGQGYWKNHPDTWSHVVLFIGDREYTPAEALDVLDTPARGDASVILATQLIASELNAWAGADTRSVEVFMDASHDLIGALDDHNPVPLQVASASEEGQAMTFLADQLDAWNNSDCIE